MLLSAGNLGNDDTCHTAINSSARGLTETTPRLSGSMHMQRVSVRGVLSRGLCLGEAGGRSRRGAVVRPLRASSSLHTRFRSLSTLRTGAIPDHVHRVWACCSFWRTFAFRLFAGHVRALDFADRDAAMRCVRAPIGHAMSDSGLTNCRKLASPPPWGPQHSSSLRGIAGVCNWHARLLLEPTYQLSRAG